MGPDGPFLISLKRQVPRSRCRHKFILLFPRKRDKFRPSFSVNGAAGFSRRFWHRHRFLSVVLFSVLVLEGLPFHPGRLQLLQDMFLQRSSLVPIPMSYVSSSAGARVLLGNFFFVDFFFFLPARRLGWL